MNKECNVCGRPNGMHHRDCPLKKYTGSWCCGGQHYQKDCPQAGIQRELEKARRYSEELHAELFYNQGGAIRISKLTKQQKKDIQKQQPIPQPESSVKEPFEDVKRRKIEDEEIFKKPKDGVRPPQKAVPKENKVQEWIEEQNKAKYQPEPVTERYTSAMKKFEELEKEQRKMTPSPKGQRIPRKQTCPRKSIGTLDENETEEEEESFRRQKYQKSTASQETSWRIPQESSHTRP